MTKGDISKKRGQILCGPGHLEQKSTTGFNKMMEIGDLIRIPESVSDRLEVA